MELDLAWCHHSCIAGVDEAGRGPLAGPVVAAAVVLDPNQPIAGLMDSKQLSAAKREALYPIIQQQAACMAIAEASVEEIDQINILQATMLAMQRAVAALALQPEHVLVDGNRCPNLQVTSTAIVKGDSKVAAISAASILAKVYRDQLLLDYAEVFPEYGFDQHKGYGTKAHMEALRKFGPCLIHRKSFAPVAALIAVN